MSVISPHSPRVAHDTKLRKKLCLRAHLLRPPTTVSAARELTLSCTYCTY